MERLSWNDRVYGRVAIDDPRIQALVESPSFTRLERVRQAGPSALVFPYKTVTRHEHSLGVHHLLVRLGAGPREQVAGLLHDIAHTAFSHAVDFVYNSDEQDHHERIKPAVLHRPDLEGPLRDLGFAPEEFYDDSIYPLLEQPLPWLCADRLDYFLRDSLACEVSTPQSVARTLDSLTVIDGVIAFTDPDVARDATERYALMNRDFWASHTESYIYNEFGEALREALRLGELDESTLLEDDQAVLARLQASRSRLVGEKLANVLNFQPSKLTDYVPRIIPKQRWLDPPVAIGPGHWQLLSERQAGTEVPTRLR